MVDVAVINTSEEMAELLELVFQSEGLSTARGYTLDFKRGREDLSSFFEKHDPRVVVWDVAIPYEENWLFCQQAQQLPAAEERHFVLTTTNVDALHQLVGSNVPAQEILGKPIDLEQLVTMVKNLLRSA